MVSIVWYYVQLIALCRGHLQRCRFKEQIAMFREQERNRKLMEEFASRLVGEQDESFLQNFMETLSLPETFMEEPDGITTAGHDC